MWCAGARRRVAAAEGRGLFKAREQIESGHGGPAAAAAALSVDQLLFQNAPAEPLPLRERLLQWKAALERRCHAADLAPDLADDIGSARWFRGLGTLVGLSVAALAFWPDFSALEAASTMPIDAGTRDEFRSQMIVPLALGADSGRRMGPTSRVAPLAAAPERPRIELAATLGHGDSFGRMLQRAGVGAVEAARLSDLVASSLPLGDIEPGTRFDIALGQRLAPGQPRPLESLGFRARFDLDLAVTRRDGALVLERHPIAVDSTPLRITGRVGASLYRSARAAGAPVRAIQQYLQTLDQHLDLESDIAAGDTFDIVIAYKRSARGENQPGNLLYAGLERGGRPRLQLLRWGRDGQFFAASGLGGQRTTQYAPVAGRITSGYGMRRHPILGYSRMHSGVDYGAAWGTPIFAVADGVVAFSGRRGGHGNYVRVDHGGGVGTGYGHMSRIAVGSGTPVRAGQVIGYVGSTGLSTGPHLHFEAYRNGRTVNPLSMRFATLAAVDHKELSAFKARLAEIRAVVPGEAFASLAPKEAEIRQPEREIARLAD